MLQHEEMAMILFSLQEMQGGKGSPIRPSVRPWLVLGAALCSEGSSVGSQASVSCSAIALACP